jgi:hypothetical protein
MNTNEKIAKWLGLIPNIKDDIIIYWEDKWGVRWYSKPIGSFRRYNLDFLHDRNQQKWIIDELKKRGYVLVFIIDSKGAECLIYGEPDKSNTKELLHKTSNKDEDLAFISAVEQLIDKENEVNESDLEDILTGKQP